MSILSSSGVGIVATKKRLQDFLTTAAEDLFAFAYGAGAYHWIDDVRTVGQAFHYAIEGLQNKFDAQFQIPGLTIEEQKEKKALSIIKRKFVDSWKNRYDLAKAEYKEHVLELYKEAFLNQYMGQIWALWKVGI